MNALFCRVLMMMMVMGGSGRNYTADNDVYGWDGTLLHFVTFWTDGKIRFQIEYRRARGHEPRWPDDCKFGPIH